MHVSASQRERMGYPSVGAARLRNDDFPEIRLPEKEYAIVKSAKNTVYYARFEGHACCDICVDQDDGAYVYSFVVNDFDNYRIFRKERIE